MKKIVVLLIGIICLNYNICSSQISEQYQDAYIIVLDIQQQSYSNEQQESSAMELTQKVNSLIDNFDPDKVIYIKNTKKLLSLSLKGILVDTIPVRDLDSNLKIVSKNIFTKYSGDAFTSAELNTFLESNKAGNIILVGRLAEECLYQTALGGKNKGYDIYIIPEAIMGKTKEKKEKAIKRMIKKKILLFPIE